MKGAITLADVAARGQTVLEIACAPCGRRGRYRVAGLIERYGADMGLPELKHRLADGCAKRDSRLIYDQCQAMIAR